MYSEIIQDIFTLVLIPLAGIITKYLIEFLKSKKVLNEANKILTSLGIDIKTADKYTNAVIEIIVDCIIATNAEYVSHIKGTKEWTKEAQEIALQKTYTKVMTLLTEEAKDVLTELYGDLNAYLITTITSYVDKIKVKKA